ISHRRARAAQNDVGHALADDIVASIHWTAAALGFQPALVADDLFHFGKLVDDELTLRTHGFWLLCLNRIWRLFQI
ncbi:MAG TPA: hypothetical protein VEO95_06255, partial [Chthoniobacteraceae bacterium]|nr:hypothetical protein [Chthoniobacteraceae bacterium]